MKKIIFYDLETTGRSAYWDQIIQIAAICTDEHLNVLDEINLIGKLNSFSVPDPEALLVNKIPIDSIYKSNFSNYSLITEISNKFSEWSPATFIGYNSIKFDEEVIRNAFFKNLFDPYLTVKNNNTRVDLLDITRIANFFYPNKIKSLLNKKGSAIMKLESIAHTNGIKNFTAHDAMGDTYASLELAKLIKNQIPELWYKSISQNNKIQLEESIASKPFCHLESFFGKSKLFCLSFVGFHPKYKWALCFDLFEDPKKVLDMNKSELYTFLESSPKKIRKIKLNKSPILLDVEMKKILDEYNVVSDDILLDRHNFISNNQEFKDKVLSCYNDIISNESQLDVYAEESIYKKFVPNSDSSLMKEFQKADWKNKFIIMEKFRDERLKYFAEILIFEEQPDLLERNTFLKIKDHLKKRIMSTNKEKWLTIYDAYKKIDDLRVKYDNNKEYLFILEDVNKYIEKLEQKFNS
ncbi:exonuclease domain-containing protein [Alphaproteobacteria bacterium]|nr:exonuclease domain-containing protein [Alphaproteobacteria bacterium]